MGALVVVLVILAPAASTSTDVCPCPFAASFSDHASAAARSAAASQSAASRTAPGVAGASSCAKEKGRMSSRLSRSSSVVKVGSSVARATNGGKVSMQLLVVFTTPRVGGTKSGSSGSRPGFFQ